MNTQPAPSNLRFSGTHPDESTRPHRLVGRRQPRFVRREGRAWVDGPPPVVRLVVAHGAVHAFVGAAHSFAPVGARALAAAGHQIAGRERIPRVRDQIIKEEAGRPRRRRRTRSSASFASRRRGPRVGTRSSLPADICSIFEPRLGAETALHRSLHI